MLWATSKLGRVPSDRHKEDSTRNGRSMGQPEIPGGSFSPSKAVAGDGDSGILNAQNQIQRSDGKPERLGKRFGPQLLKFVCLGLGCRFRRGRRKKNEGCQLAATDYPSKIGCPILE